MDKKAVIFNELKAQLAEILDFFPRVPVETIYCSDGKNSLELILKNNPEVAILGVAMPGLSGIEVSRRIKIDEGKNDIKIVLVSDFVNESIKNRAIEAGCDLYLSSSEVPRNLYSYVETLFKVPPRTDLRIQINIEVQLLLKGKQVLARSLNLSRSGVLASSPEEIPIGENLQVVIKCGSEIEDLKIEGIVSRLIEIPDEGGSKIGLGIKFINLNEQIMKRLDEFINHSRGELKPEFKGKKIDLKPIIDFFLSEDAYFAEYLGNVMRSGDSPQDGVIEESQGGGAQEFKFHLPKLMVWEIGAFGGGTEETEVYLSVIRQLVMLWVKLENLHRVLNDIPFCDSEDERTIFNILENSLEIGATAEKEAEQILNSNISMRAVGLSSQIAKTRNKYSDVKVRVIKGILERYEPILDRKPQLQGHLDNFKSIFEQMKSDSLERKDGMLKGSEAKREITRETFTPEPVKAKVSGRSKFYFIGLGVFLLAVLLIVFLNIGGKKIDISKYSNLTIIKSGIMEENVLILTCQDNWNPARDKKITKVLLENIMEAARKDEIYKLKLIDSAKKTLGIVISNSDKKQIVMVH